MWTIYCDLKQPQMGGVSPGAQHLRAGFCCLLCDWGVRRPQGLVSTSWVISLSAANTATRWLLWSHQYCSQTAPRVWQFSTQPPMANIVQSDADLTLVRLVLMVVWSCSGLCPSVRWIWLPESWFFFSLHQFLFIKYTVQYLDKPRWN